MNKSTISVAVITFGFLALSTVAAAKDKEVEGEQMLISPPLLAEAYQCSALNVTDRNLDIEILIRGNDDSISSYVSVDPLKMESWIVNLGSIQTAHCIISWTGFENDLKATFCARQIEYGPTGCVGF